MNTFIPMSFVAQEALSQAVLRDSSIRTVVVQSDAEISPSYQIATNPDAMGGRIVHVQWRIPSWDTVTMLVDDVLAEVATVMSGIDLPPVTAAHRTRTNSAT